MDVSVYDRHLDLVYRILCETSALDFMVQNPAPGWQIISRAATCPKSILVKANALTGFRRDAALYAVNHICAASLLYRSAVDHDSTIRHIVRETLMHTLLEHPELTL